MQTKLIEIRDRASFVPAMAIRVSSTGDAAADWLLRRAGYSTVPQCAWSVAKRTTIRTIGRTAPGAPPESTK